MNGWKPDILAEGIKQCAFSKDSSVQYCLPFKPSLDPSFSKTCPQQPPLDTEPVYGTIDKLPGCITVTSGPLDAQESDMNCANGANGANGANRSQTLSAPIRDSRSRI